MDDGGGRFDDGDTPVSPEGSDGAAPAPESVRVPWLQAAIAPRSTPEVLETVASPDGDEPFEGERSPAGEHPSEADLRNRRGRLASRLRPTSSATTVVERPGLPWRTAAAVVVALALLSGSAFAYLSVTAPDGAPNAQAAVQQMFAAIDAEDVAGVLESLPAGERDVIRQPVTDIVTELARLGVLGSFSLDQVPGADIQVQGLTMQADPIAGRDNLTAVTLTGGTISTRLVPESLPIGDTLRHALTEGMGDKINIGAETATHDLAADRDRMRIMTVKDGDGWHVSLFYTIAEAVRGVHAEPLVLAKGPDPVGSATPDGALRDLVDGAVNLDLERVVTMLPPDEMQVAYDYAPLFLPRLAPDGKAAGRDRPTIQLHRLDTRTDGDGEVRRVVVTAFDVEVSGPYDSSHVSYDGRCVTVLSTTDRDRASDRNSCSSGAAGSGPGSGPVNDFALFNGLGPTFAVVVVERDGRWYVSPTRTLFDSALTSLRNLTPADLQAWSERLSSSSREATPRTSGTVTPSIDPMVPSTDGTTPGAAAGSLFAACASREPSGLASTASAPRQDYLRTQVMQQCLEAGGVVDGGYRLLDPCFAAYDALAPGSAEDAWKAADAVVASCLAGASLPPGTVPPSAAVGTAR